MGGGCRRQCRKRQGKKGSAIVIARGIRRWGSGGRRAVLAVLICILVLSGVSTAAVLYGNTGVVHAATPPTDVLLVHGWNANGQVDCAQTWQPVKDYFASHWPAASLHTVSYYVVNNNTQPPALGDTNCDSDSSPVYGIGNHPGPILSDGVQACSRTTVTSVGFYNPSFNGTTNEDIEHLACEMAWLIWDQYTSQGKPVIVLAHSMGGLIIRDALYETAARHYTPNPFPDHLYVPAVVTFGSPHVGLTEVGDLVGDANCNCSQPGQMTVSPDNPWLADLVANGANPQGFGGTSWMTIAMLKSQRYTYPVTSSGCTVNMGNDNPNWADPVGEIMSGGVQVLYYRGTGTNNSVCYSHGGYLLDESTATDAFAIICNGTCADNEAYNNNGQTYSHSIQAACQFLGGHAPMPYVVGGSFYTLWQQYGGACGPLGYPLESSHTVTGGQVQHFAGTSCGAASGSGIYSSSAGTFEVQGCIYQKYVALHETGFAFPKSNEYGVSYGRATDLVGPTCGGSGGGHIYYSTTSQAHEIHGCIATYYLGTMGGPSGNPILGIPALGFPTTDEYSVGTGVANGLEGTSCGSAKYGHIWYSGSAHVTYGCIEKEYLAVGGPAGFLGFPTQNEYSIAGGRASDFVGTSCGSSSYGHIYKLPTIANAYEVHGCIAQTYLNLGGPGSAYGFPITDEFTNPRTGWRESDFQNGCIIWNSTGGHTYLWTNPYSVKYCD